MDLLPSKDNRLPNQVTIDQLFDRIVKILLVQAKNILE